MDRTVTLQERKTAEQLRRQRSANAIKEALGRYCAERGGRFMIFGSVAKGMISHRSDLDIVVDFPPDRERAAVDYLEELGMKYRLDVDIHTVATTREAFLQRIAEHAVVIG